MQWHLNSQISVIVISVCLIAPIWDLHYEETAIPDTNVASASSVSPQYPTSPTCSSQHYYPSVTIRLVLASQGLPIPGHGALCVENWLYIQRDSVLVPAKQNLQGAITHPEVGPFYPHVVPNVHI